MKREHSKERCTVHTEGEVKKQEMEGYRKVYAVHESSWLCWHQKRRNHGRLLLGPHHCQPRLGLPALWGSLAQTNRHLWTADYADT